MSKKTKHQPTTLPEVKNLNLLCNIVNIDDCGNTPTNQEEDFESCLNELDQTNAPGTQSLSSQPISTISDATLPPILFHDERLWNPTLSLEKKYRRQEKLTSFPNIQLEIFRHFQVNQLSSFLLQNTNLRMPSFERWVIDSKLYDKQQSLKNQSAKRKSMHYDPILPSSPNSSDPPCIRLMEEITESSSHDDDDDDNESLSAKQVIQQLCIKTVESIQKLSNMNQRLFMQSEKNAGKVILETSSDLKEDETRDIKMYSLTYKRRKSKPFRIQINSPHYHKLWQMFLLAHDPSFTSLSSTKKHPLQNSFHTILFATLLRYSTLSGGHQINDLRGGGMQGSIHSQVFSFLHQTLNCTMECFASPFNTFLKQYCSAFPDLDNHFHSLGDFFHLNILEDGDETTCLEVNPPFAPGLMYEMACKLNNDLKKVDEQGKELTYVIILPTCAKDSLSIVQKHAQKSFRYLLQSPFFVVQFQLRKQEHGYVEGSQQLRPTRYKESRYDTSVIVLQSEKARMLKNENDWKEFDKGLRVAFASRHEQELNERRKRLGKDDVISDDVDDDDWNGANSEKKKRKKLESKEKLKQKRAKKVVK